MGSFGDLRQRAREVQAATKAVARLAASDHALCADIRALIARDKEIRVRAQLYELPLDALRDATEIPLRLGVVRRAGLHSVGSVYESTAEELARIQGVSAAGARDLKLVAQAIYETVQGTLGVELNVDSLSSADQALLRKVRDLDALRAQYRGDVAKLPVLSDCLNASATQTRLLNSRLRWLLSRPVHRQQAIDALVSGEGMLKSVEFTKLVAAATVVESQASENLPDETLGLIFQQRSSDFYAVIESVTGSPTKLGQRYIDHALLERIEQQDLDSGLLKATLRQYQIFGSKFALTQNRVIIGDEMGLGKTMQALAAVAQRHATGATHFLVVCPASVLVNWQREIEARSSLPLVRIHGETQSSGLESWRVHGGVALTTYDTIKLLKVSDSEIQAIGVDTLIADEAHYIKNPATGRSRHLARWINHVPRVIFLTGTPLENRVEEFINLVRLLDPPFAGTVNRAALAGGPEAFRRHVAPIYLRRNVDEVLAELPQLIEIDENCTWDGGNYMLYLDGIAESNLMSMRRAGMLPAIRGARSNKMQRLCELVEEAFSNQRKVIVFSFFREVLDEVMKVLGSRAMGPITGDTSPNARQAIVDAFSVAAEPRVLVGQIQAAGTGLNIQAASTVILCEPQIKPSLEVQAIARAYRMGQVRNVQVHRLLIDDSADTLMRNLLAVKQEEFNAFARDSELANATLKAKDRSEESLAQVIVLAERRRLGLMNPGQPRL